MAILITGGLEPLPDKPPHVNPPIPLFKIPPAQWPIVLQSVAQGESLRQIAWSYYTSDEAVRRVLHTARKALVGRASSDGYRQLLHLVVSFT